MRLLTFLLLLPALAFGQELHTFQNGEVADADKINQNFNYVLENASGGCSATQQDNNVLIECADGTSGVIAGAGAVLLIPEGEVGETPDYSAVNVGEFYWADGNGVFLGRRDGGLESSVNQNVVSDYCPRVGVECVNDSHYFKIDLAMNHTTEQVFIDPYNYQVVYTQPDCEGPPLTQGIVKSLFMLGGTYAVYREESLPSDTLLYSIKDTKYFDNSSSVWVEESECFNFDEPRPGNGKFVITYTPAPEILNAAYPVRLEQLP